MRVVRFLDANLVIGSAADFFPLAKTLLHFCRINQTGVAVHLTNAYTLSCAKKDGRHAALIGANLSLPDGVPLAKLLRLKFGSGGHMYGPHLFRDVIALSAKSGMRHFLLGASENVNAALASRIQSLYPGVVISGRYSPPFGDFDADHRKKICAMLQASEADFIWVGLGTPKQDFEADALASLYPGVFFAVGAAFDFHAGSKKDCPDFIRNIGLQWFYRLCQEPRRLWRRYLVGNINFLLVVIQKWRQSGQAENLENWLDQSRPNESRGSET